MDEYTYAEYSADKRQVHAEYKTEIDKQRDILKGQRDQKLDLLLKKFRRSTQADVAKKVRSIKVHL